MDRVNRQREEPDNQRKAAAFAWWHEPAWLDAAGICEGPIFRPVRKGGKERESRLTAKSVCDLTKSYAGKLGLNAADYGAHSLRAGFLTSAARRGAGVFKMRDESRHKSMEVLQGYVRDADMFRDHAGADLP